MHSASTKLFSKRKKCGHANRTLRISRASSLSNFAWFVRPNFLLDGSLMRAAFSSGVEEAGIEELPIMLFAVAALLQLIPAVIGIIGGYQMFQFQKKGLWLVLTSLVLGWVIGIVNSALTSDYGGSGDAGIDAAFSGVCGLGCVAVCGLIVCIPLLFAHNGLE